MDELNRAKQLNRVMKNVADLSKELTLRKHEFLKQIFVSSSALLGIIICLLRDTPKNQLQEAFLVIGIALLSLGILSLGMSLYAFQDAIYRTRKAYLNEYEKAKNENRDLEPVFVPNRKIFRFFEILSFAFLGLAVVCLSLFAVFSILD